MATTDANGPEKSRPTKVKGKTIAPLFADSGEVYVEDIGKIRLQVYQMLRGKEQRRTIPTGKIQIDIDPATTTEEEICEAYRGFGWTKFYVDATYADGGGQIKGSGHTFHAVDLGKKDARQVAQAEEEDDEEDEDDEEEEEAQREKERQRDLERSRMMPGYGAPGPFGMPGAPGPFGMAPAMGGDAAAEKTLREYFQKQIDSLERRLETAGAQIEELRHRERTLIEDAKSRERTHEAAMQHAGRPEREHAETLRAEHAELARKHRLDLQHRDDEVAALRTQYKAEVDTARDTTKEEIRAMRAKDEEDRRRMTNSYDADRTRWIDDVSSLRQQLLKALDEGQSERTRERRKLEEEIDDLKKRYRAENDELRTRARIEADDAKRKHADEIDGLRERYKSVMTTGEKSALLDLQRVTKEFEAKVKSLETELAETKKARDAYDQEAVALRRQIADMPDVKTVVGAEGNFFEKYVIPITSVLKNFTDANPPEEIRNKVFGEIEKRMQAQFDARQEHDRQQIHAQLSAQMAGQMAHERERMSQALAEERERVAREAAEHYAAQAASAPPATAVAPPPTPPVQPPQPPAPVVPVTPPPRPPTRPPEPDPEPASRRVGPRAADVLAQPTTAADIHLASWPVESSDIAGVAADLRLDPVPATPGYEFVVSPARARTESASPLPDHVNGADVSATATA